MSKTQDKILKHKIGIPSAHCVAVSGGRATVTNLEQALVVKTTLADGVYDTNNLPTQEFTLDDMMKLPESCSIDKMVSLGSLSRGEVETLARASMSCSTDSTRPALTGVMFEQRWAVATDGYIMSEMLHRLKLGDKRIIVPKQAIELIKLFIKDFTCSDVAVYLSDADATVAFAAPDGSAVLYSKLIDATFPDWRYVLDVNK